MRSSWLAAFALLPLTAAAGAPAGKGPLPDEAALARMTARFSPTELRVDVSGLSAGDRKALAKLIEAGRVYDELFLRQVWSGATRLQASLAKDTSPLGRARARYFRINKGPWSALDGHTAFLPGVPTSKPAGAAFYPEDATREELETWMKGLSAADREAAQGFFTVVVRGKDRKLSLRKFADAYRPELTRAASLLKEAAALTENASLRSFLTKRADAFLSNDYYASDVAWMDLDAPLEPTIGPYETYNDELFGYKAAFEAYITVRDEAETKKLGAFAARLQEIEDHLPIDPARRNPKLGALAPIRVVNVVLSGGDGNHGVQTAAYNLPNDERVVAEKGSKRVMLKNVQQAKFDRTLVPLSRKALSAADQKDLSFDAFFTHILAHELTHGLGPQVIKVDGRETSARQELKELYGTIEEAKADITGLFALQYLMDHGPDGLVPKGEEAERRLYTTFLASAFRTLRFGLTESHAKGMAIQMNLLLEKGGFKVAPDGTFQVDFSRIKDAVREVDTLLLDLEATGDLAGARKLLAEKGGIPEAVKRVIDASTDIPTDIEPIFVTAEELAPVRR